MAAFKDSSGRQWLIEIDVNQVKRLRSELDLDLLELLTEGNNVLERLDSDPVLLVDCLWVLCREQAQAKQIDDIGFGRGLVGDAIEEAAAALMEAICDFFPRGRRETLKAVAAKLQEVRTLGETRALEKMADPRINTAIQKMLDRAELKFASELDRVAEGKPPGFPQPKVGRPKK